MFLPDDVSPKNDVSPLIVHKHDRISAGVAKHEADLDNPITKTEIDGVSVSLIRQHESFDQCSFVGFGIGPEEFKILCSLPAQHIALRDDRCAGFGKNGVASYV